MTPPALAHLPLHRQILPPQLCRVLLVRYLDLGVPQGSVLGPVLKSACLLQPVAGDCRPLILPPFAAPHPHPNLTLLRTWQ